MHLETRAQYRRRSQPSKLTFDHDCSIEVGTNTDCASLHKGETKQISRCNSNLHASYRRFAVSRPETIIWGLLLLIMNSLESNQQRSTVYEMYDICYIQCRVHRGSY